MTIKNERSKNAIKFFKALMRKNACHNAHCLSKNDYGTIRLIFT